jgi:hypothetical protein
MSKISIDGSMLAKILAEEGYSLMTAPYELVARLVRAPDDMAAVRRPPQLKPRLKRYPSSFLRKTSQAI